MQKEPFFKNRLYLTAEQVLASMYPLTRVVISSSAAVVVAAAAVVVAAGAAEVAGAAVVP